MKQESLVKTSLVFLGSIVAATFCAHKFWPKGVTYGDKEEWEIEEVTARIKRDLADEKRSARRRRPASMMDDGRSGVQSRAGYGYDAYPGRGPERGYWDERSERADTGRHGARGGRRRSYYATDRGGEDFASGSSSGRSAAREREDSRERYRGSGRAMADGGVPGTPTVPPGPENPPSLPSGGLHVASRTTLPHRNDIASPLRRTVLDRRVWMATSLALRVSKAIAHGHPALRAGGRNPTIPKWSLSSSTPPRRLV